MAHMLNDPLIRIDEPIPADAKLEFRAVLSFDDVEVAEYLEDGETEITLRELLARMKGTDGPFSGGDQYERMRKETGGNYEVIDTAWYAAVDVPNELDRARFEWGWEKQKREEDEARPAHTHAMAASDSGHSMSLTVSWAQRYRHPWRVQR
jgi:hypothetical protein